MKSLFNNIYVSGSEYSYIRDIKPREKLNYLFEIFELEVKKQNGFVLADFFNAMQNFYSDRIQNDQVEHTQSRGFDPSDKDRIDVLIDDDHILIESNSLSAVRHIVYKFFESGYVLQRNIETEKMFRKDKLTRYLRVYDIVGEHNTLCLN
jgi:hypothetical protein